MGEKDFKNENEQLRELIKSSSRNEIRKQLFARVRTNDKSIIKNVKQVLNMRMLENAGKVLNIDEIDLKLFADAYSTYLKNSGTETLVVADNRTYPYRINFGKYLLTPSCSSPYPGCETIANILYVCPHCFSYFSSSRVFLIHSNICKIEEPPGRVVYHEDDIMIYEVDGEAQKEYCTQLCLFSRAFLDHKTAYNSCNTFLFYIVVKATVKLLKGNSENSNVESKAKTEYETIGYFSKESEQTGQSFNLSCIVVWPPYLRQGFGFFMIDFSYLISRFEQRTGSPEKPFSALGAATYFSYWRQKILAHVHKTNQSEDFSLSIADISSETSISPDDLLQTFEMYNYLIFDKESNSLLFNITQSELAKIKVLKLAKKEFFLNQNCTLHDNLSNFGELNVK